MWIHALVQKSFLKTLLAHIIVLHFPYFPVLYISCTAVQPSKPLAWTFLELGFKLQTWIIDKLRVLAEANAGWYEPHQSDVFSFTTPRDC